MALTKASRSMLNTGISDSSDATALTFSSAEDATFAGHVILGDNKYLKMGASNDLLLVHDGSDSYIIDNGTGNLVVAGSAVYIKNAAYNEQMISAIQDAQVELYYNNSLKLATANDGIDVTGHIDATTITTTGAGTIGGNLTVTGNLQVDGTTTTINSTTYTVDDLNITLASGAGSSSAADGAGITIDGASATWNYTHSNTSWVANKNVRAPRFLSTSNSSSNFYSVLATRSGSGTSNPDIYGSSNTLVLGYSDSGKAVHFNSTGATFTGTISSGAITSTGTLGITGAISSGADTTLATFGRAGSAVSSSIIYADATTDMEFGTTTGHALSLITGDTRRLTIDSSGNATFSAHLIVDGNTTLGNADTDTVTIPGDLAVDTDTLFVDVSADRVGINDNSPDEVLTLKSDSGGIRIKGVTTTTKGLSLRYDESAGESEIRSDQTGVNQINLKYRALNHIFGRNNSLEYLRITDAGNIGIGEDTPLHPLQISGGLSDAYHLSFDRGNSTPGGSDPWLGLYNNQNIANATYGWGWYDSSSDGSLQLWNRNNSTTGYVVLSAKRGGNVGINSSNPQTKFVVQHTDGHNGIEFSMGSTLNYIQSYNRNTSDYSNLKIDGETIKFGTNDGTERMRINANGNIFFGTTTEPTGMASSSYKQIKIGGGLLADSGHSSGHNIILANNVHVGASNDLKFTHAAAASSVSLTGGKIYFRTHDGGGASANATASLNQRMMIHSNGRVRIGDTSTPGALLDVGNVTNQYPLKLRGNLDSSGGYSGITFGYESDTNAYEKARIRVEGTSGNVQPEFHVLIDHDASSSSAEKSDAMISVVSNDQNKKMVVIDAGKQGNSYDIDAPSSGEVLLVQGPIASGRTASIGDAQGTTGRWVHNWWHGSTGNGTSLYTHIETDLWGGGSPSGNSQFIMGGFWIKGYQYGGGNNFCIHQFHNWSGALYNHHVSDLGSWTGKTHVYVSSNGYVTVRLDSRGSYRMWDIDLVQYAQYNKRDISVRSETRNSASTI